MSNLDEWTQAVCRELGIEDVLDRTEVTGLVLDLARDVAHGVARPAAPLTTFLVGVAVGRSVLSSTSAGVAGVAGTAGTDGASGTTGATGGAVTAELSTTVSRMAESWGG